MVWEPTASGFETAVGRVAIPELLTVMAGWIAPSTAKTTDPTGTSVPAVAKIVALTAVEPKVGVATFNVVVVATVSPAPAVNCTVCVALVFRALSVMLADPVTGAVDVGRKSTTSAQPPPGANANG